MPGTPEALHLTQSQTLLVFTARTLWVLLFITRETWGGELVWCWDPLLLRGDLHSGDISCNFYPLHMGVGTALCVSAPPTSLDVAFSSYP